jgi:hypothetical protein
VTRHYLFETAKIVPQPTLAQLRDYVISHSEKRSPKWKWQIAPDLLMQLQPKLAAPPTVIRFEGVAISSADVELDLLLKPWKEVDHNDALRMNFELRAIDPAAWTLHPRSYNWKLETWVSGRRHRPGKWNNEVNQLNHEFRLRLVRALGHDWYDRQFEPPPKMAAHCMICGKALTDPVSMARWIGPECFGSASTNLPNVFKAEPA